jgi:hypothetical protein
VLPGEFGEGEKVWYSGASGAQSVEVLTVHREDVTPYYTILVFETGTHPYKRCEL